MEKYARVRQVTDYYILRRKRVTYWITKARRTHARTHTHTENMKYLLLFHSKNGYENAPQRYVKRTLPFLFKLTSTRSSGLCTSHNSDDLLLCSENFFTVGRITAQNNPYFIRECKYEKYIDLGVVILQMWTSYVSA